jgi:hypothetical protein
MWSFSYKKKVQTLGNAPLQQCIWHLDSCLSSQLDFSPLKAASRYGEFNYSGIPLQDWTWNCTFDLSAGFVEVHPRHLLHFESLDAIASITLNGATLGATASAHRPHAFDATGYLQQGSNSLLVKLESPVKYAALQAATYPYPVPTTQVGAGCGLVHDCTLRYSFLRLDALQPVLLESCRRCSSVGFGALWGANLAESLPSWGQAGHLWASSSIEVALALASALQPISPPPHRDDISLGSCTCSKRGPCPITTSSARPPPTLAGIGAQPTPPWASLEASGSAATPPPSSQVGLAAVLPVLVACVAKFESFVWHAGRCQKRAACTGDSWG